MRIVTRKFRGSWVLLLAVALTACATTRQSTKEAERSGFLGDYSQLREGGDDQAQLVYVNPDAAWASYDAVMIDSVTIWRDARTEDVPAEDAQRLTDSLYAALHEQLRLDYRIVNAPGPRVLRLRAAITEAKGSMVVMDAVTSLVPQLRAVATLGGLATGTAVLVGKAGVEAELTDSLSGRRLAAAVDERWGTKAIRGGIAEWSDADEAFVYWAKRLRERLAERRAAAR